MTVNQRVAGSSPASGAKAPHVRGAFFIPQNIKTLAVLAITDPGAVF